MSESPYADLLRPPLHEAALRRALVVPGAVWTDVRVVAETGSTNADLVAAARSGADEGLVLVAERQTAGRGRLGRYWQAPPRAGLTLSVLLRPDAGLPAARLGWLPLLGGIAVVEVVARLGAVDAALKWPNDLLVRSVEAGRSGAYAKCAGLLAEAVPAPGRGTGEGVPVPTGIVLGIGLNVSQRADELPPPPDPAAPPVTSLALSGSACTDRDPLLRAILRTLAEWYGRWRSAEGDPQLSGVADAYREHCATLGGPVRVDLPDGTVLTGHASDVDDEGRLVVRTGEGDHRHVAAGDVWHLR